MPSLYRSRESKMESLNVFSLSSAVNQARMAIVLVRPIAIVVEMQYREQRKKCKLKGSEVPKLEQSEL